MNGKINVTKNSHKFETVWFEYIIAGPGVLAKQLTVPLAGIFLLT